MSVAGPLQRRMFERRLISLVFAVLLIGTDGAARPPLVDAGKNGDSRATRALLEQGEDANQADADGSTALHWACYRDDLESAEMLIRAGANVDAATDLGVTALWAASQNGSVAMVGRLLEAGAKPNTALLLGETPVMVAARSGYPEVVELLLSKGGEVNARAGRGQTALMWAAAQSHSDVVKVLLAHGADVDMRSETWSQMMALPPHGYPDYNRAIPHGGNTALMFAARAGDLASAKLLAAAGANVDDKNAWGVSAMVMAAHSGFREIVEFLLEKEADPSLAEAGFSALHVAIMRRDEKMASALLSHGADPTARLRTWTPTRRSSKDLHFPPELVGATPFWLAARFAQPGVMRLLAAHGADPLFVHHADYVTGSGWQRQAETTTALMAALGMGSGKAWVQPRPFERERLALEAVKLAVELGVDVNVANTDGSTALAAAKALGYRGVVDFLVENGAK